MKSIKISVCILGLFLSHHILMAGGWPQLQFHGYFKLSQWGIISTEHFTDTGLKDPNVTNGLFNTSIYAEYGFTNRLTGIVYAPFFSRALFNNTVSGTTGEVLIPGEAINSFGDTDIAIKYGLIINKPVVVSATLLLGIPLGNAAGGSDGALQTGDGEFNQMLQIDVGTSFKLGKFDAYANVYTAFNNRTRGFSDEVRFGIEGGVTFGKEKFIAILRAYGIKSLKNGSLNSPIMNTSIFANNSEHISISPELNYQFTSKWGISVNATRPVWGRIIFANTAFSGGIYLKI